MTSSRLGQRVHIRGGGGEGRWLYSEGCGFVSIVNGLGRWVVWADEEPPLSGAGSGDAFLSSEITLGMWMLTVDTALEVIVGAGTDIVAHDVTEVLTVTDCA